MRFDKTFIAIRERKILEILDLSLHVVRRYLGQLLVLLFVGVLPWLIIDSLLIGWLLSNGSETDRFARDLFLVTSTILIVSQSQVASMYITHFLGQAMFVGQPKVWDSIKAVIRGSNYLIWLHYLLRLVIPISLVALLIPMQVNPQQAYPIVVIMFMMLFVAVMVRCFRPYVTEVILLEQTPVRTEGNRVTFSKRSNALHAEAASELFGRGFVTGIWCLLLASCIFSGLLTTDLLLNIRGPSQFPFGCIYWNAALWLVVGFASVVRFLSYIDLRIRQEGWAVELKVRAEVARVLNMDKLHA